MAEAASDVSPDNQDEKKQHETGRYLPALVLVAAIIQLPFLAALITIMVYISPSSLPEVAFFSWLGPGNMVVILGLIITLVLWFILAIPCMRFATAQSGKPSEYEGLQRELTVLRKELNVVKEYEKTSKTAIADIQGNVTIADIQGNVTIADIQGDVAIADIQGNLDHINTILKGKGFTWLSTGYISLWDRINKADEAIIDVLPCETVIESAKYEALRLKKSEVPGSEELLTLLEKAITTLSSDPDGSKLSSARSDIRKVKAALHKFTNERWEALVRLRNQLIGTAFLTAFLTYILVVFAILANVQPTRILEAMVLYFLGAIVGLLGRLLDERKVDPLTDGYGLSMTRIIVTPLISGLAALIGVLIATILSISISTASISVDISIWRTPESLRISLENLILAAIFGYMPNLLINILQSKSEAIKGQLKSASPSDQRSGNGSSGSSKGNSSGGSS